MEHLGLCENIYGVYMRKRSLIIRTIIILSVTLVACFIAYISICMSYANKHVLVYNATDQTDRTELLKSFSVRDSDLIDDVVFMYRNRDDMYCLRIVTKDVEGFLQSSIDGQTVGGSLPDFSNYVESNYKVESFEREKLSVYKVFQIEIYGDEYKRYADIVVYPLNDEVYAIEIKMRFLFTDYPDSIVDDHWWDDSIWAKIGILN